MLENQSIDRLIADIFKENILIIVHIYHTEQAYEISYVRHMTIFFIGLLALQSCDALYKPGFVVS